jgi:hypothetical protein
MSIPIMKFVMGEDERKIMSINFKRKGEYIFIFNQNIPTKNSDISKYITVYNVIENKKVNVLLKDISFKMYLNHFNLALKDYGEIEVWGFKVKKINIIKELNMSNLLQPDFTNILPDDVEKVDSINSIFGQKTILGEYNEERTLYDGRKLYHQGIDIFWDLGTALSFPFSFEITGVYSSFDLKNSVGGVIMARVYNDQYSKLLAKEIGSEYLDFQLFHLDNNIIDTMYSHFAKEKVQLAKSEYWKILLSNPIQVKANEIFAFIGSYKNNGGWPAHLHLQFIKNKVDNGLPWNNGADFNQADLNNYNPVSLLGLDIGKKRTKMVLVGNKFVRQDLN